LDRILGIAMIPSDPIGNAKHLFAMTVVKLLKTISVTHLGARDELFVTEKLGSIGSDTPPTDVIRWNCSRGRHHAYLAPFPGVKDASLIPRASCGESQNHKRLRNEMCVVRDVELSLSSH
jgi:hypothetical protein